MYGESEYFPTFTFQGPSFHHSIPEVPSDTYHFTLIHLSFQVTSTAHSTRDTMEIMHF